MFAFLLPGCMIEEAQRTADAFLLSGVVSSKYCRQHHVIPKKRTFEVIMNCSAQLYSTGSTMNGEGVH